MAQQVMVEWPEGDAMRHTRAITVTPTSCQGPRFRGGGVFLLTFRNGQRLAIFFVFWLAVRNAGLPWCIDPNQVVKTND